MEKMRCFVGRDGYVRTQLRIGGRSRSKLVHRLVADAFLPNPEGFRCVNHLDGDKQNNRLENLEWTSHAGNRRHALAAGLTSSPRGERHGRAKLTARKVAAIRAVPARHGVLTQLARKYAVAVSTIAKIRNGGAWT